jgi:PAS domain S-box-containing protein
MRYKAENPDFVEIADTNFLSAVVENAADCVILIDVTESVRLFNPACEKLFGYKAAEMLGRNLSVLLPARDHFGHDRSLENFTSIGVGRCKDGSTFPMDLSVGRTERDGESIYVGIFRDLTQCPRVAQAMLDSEQNYRRLVERVTDYAIYMLDVDGHVTSWNSGAQRIKQYSADEIIGLHYRTFYTEEARARGEPERNLDIARRDGRCETNAWRLRKDGSQFWANVVIEPLHDESGQLIGFAKVTSDITERRNTERKMRETGEQISALIETVLDGVVQIDRLGKIQTINPACCKLFGYHQDQVIGQDIKGLIFLQDEAIHEACSEGDMRGMIGSSREVEGRRRDGSVFPMALSVGEAKHDGEPIFVFVIHDLSEHKRIQEQLVQAQKMEMVGQLSGGIAHDFNNLLTVIIGSAELLGEQLRTRQDLKRIVDDIGHAGERGAELTQRLLAFSRRQILRPVTIDCNELLASMHKLLRRTLRENIEIRTDFDPDLVPAFADPAQLESALLNLALNAQDAMASGGCLTLTTATASLDDDYQSMHPEVPPGEYIQVSVTDNGEGMAKEVFQRAFEPFFTTKEVGKGSGLGLSMVYGFMKQSNGHVSIYSEPGLGTTIRMYLPKIVTKLPQPPKQPRANANSALRGTETILVVEDDPFVRSFVVARLKELGYSVVAAVDGKDALGKLRTDIHIDILFTDVVMPGGIDGWELADRAKRVRPGLPVLLTSGYAMETLAQQGRLQPGAMVLSKPYRRDALALRLREILLVGSLSPPTSAAGIPCLSKTDPAK